MAKHSHNASQLVLHGSCFLPFFPITIPACVLPIIPSLMSFTSFSYPSFSLKLQAHEWWLNITCNAGVFGKSFLFWLQMPLLSPPQSHKILITITLHLLFYSGIVCSCTYCIIMKARPKEVPACPTQAIVLSWAFNYLTHPWRGVMSYWENLWNLPPGNSF